MEEVTLGLCLAPHSGLIFCFTVTASTTHCPTQSELLGHISPSCIYWAFWSQLCDGNKYASLE